MASSPDDRRQELEPVSTRQRQVRIWVDGCFDLMHYGHANALRQAKAMGDWLAVGIRTDAHIKKHKGPTVMTELERYQMIKAIKWVDEVVEVPPNLTHLELLDKYNCDFCAHGDDISYSIDGRDDYAEVKSAGRYKEFKRTHSVSTTDLVGRMLQMTQNRHYAGQPSEEEEEEEEEENLKKQTIEVPHLSAIPKFLFTTKKVTQFGGMKEAGPGDVVVYAPGSFDLFHPGHLSFLEKCRELGNYIIVGLHTDWDTPYKGKNCPVMNLHERVLNVLACKYVSEVVIGARHTVTEDLLDHFKVNVVVHGEFTPVRMDKDGSDPYAAAKKRGIFRTVKSESSLTTDHIVQRVISNRAGFLHRNSLKEEKELRVKAAAEQWRKSELANDTPTE